MKLPAQKKKEAVLRVVRCNEKIAAVAREYNIARKTLYSWIKRYEEDSEKNLKVFVPRYASGRGHPFAVYPGIEKKLLILIANKPYLSINSLAKNLQVSTWTIWRLLDKYNLNNKEKRFAFSEDFKLKKIYSRYKREAVYRVVKNNEKVAQVADEYGVARKTLYECIERYKESYDGDLQTFEPRYSSGKEHPNAVYPKIEEKLLVLVANKPELSISSLAHNVQVSVWTIWRLLDKYNLNTKEKRFVFADELIRRREERVPVYSEDFSFAYVGHKLRILLAVTRKIPRFAEDVIMFLYGKFVGAVASLLFSKALQSLGSNFKFKVINFAYGLIFSPKGFYWNFSYPFKYISLKLGLFKSEIKNFAINISEYL